MAYNRISPFGVQHDLVSEGEQFRAQNERSANAHHAQKLAMQAQMDLLRGSGGGQAELFQRDPNEGRDLENVARNEMMTQEKRGMNFAQGMQGDVLKNRLDVTGMQMAPRNAEVQIEREKFDAGANGRSVQDSIAGMLKQKLDAMRQPDEQMAPGAMGPPKPGGVAGDPNQMRELQTLSSIMRGGEAPNFEMQDLQMAELKAQADDRARMRAREEAERVRGGETVDPTTGKVTLPDSTTPEDLNKVIGPKVQDFINADTAWWTKDPGIQEQDKIVELYQQLAQAYARKNGGNMVLAQEQAKADMAALGKGSNQGEDYKTDNWGQQTRALYGRMR